MASTRKATNGRQAAGERASGGTRGRSVSQRVADAQAKGKQPVQADGSKARELMGKVGRPSLLTEELTFKIGEMLLAGNYRETAARACGLSPSTLKNWLARGEELEALDDSESEVKLTKDQQLYVDFVSVIRTCEAYAEVELLAEARQGETGWQAPMTILERRWPARWKKRDEIEHSGEIGHRAVLDEEQQAQELEAFGMPAALAVAAGPDAVRPPEDL